MREEGTGRAPARTHLGSRQASVMRGCQRALRVASAAHEGVRRIPLGLRKGLPATEPPAGTGEAARGQSGSIASQRRRTWGARIRGCGRWFQARELAETGGHRGLERKRAQMRRY